MAKAFQKFIQREESGARKKERIRQEKKQARKETQEFFAKKKAERRGLRPQDDEEERKGVGKKSSTAPSGGRNAASMQQSSGARAGGKSSQAGGKFSQVRGKSSQAGGKISHTGGKFSQAGGKISRAGGKTLPAGSKISGFGGKSSQTGSNISGPGGKSSQARGKISRPVGKLSHAGEARTSVGAPSKGKLSHTGEARTSAGAPAKGKPASSSHSSKTAGSSAPSKSTPSSSQESMPLNKFIAHAGICSRRDAAELVKSGKVTINGQIVTEPGQKVQGTEDIKVNGKKISARKNLVYILLNKPKDYITTTEDPQGRKTVLDIIRKATPERVYPIGRLDRNTTGVLLFTNDGELAQKLSHPSYEVKKIYEVRLDKPLSKKDFDEMSSGITLDDGPIKPDALAYADPKDRSVIGIEIHSGRNRIVRRMFEHMGYDVRNLDRVMYANLTKKNVERGKWRFLTEKEVRLLKFLNASYTRKA